MEVISLSEKKGFNFNIIKNDPLDGHKGTNIGSISLDNIAFLSMLLTKKHLLILEACMLVPKLKKV